MNAPHALTRLFHIGDSGLRLTPDLDLTTSSYSRFKYGDGTLTAQLGRRLATLAASVARAVDDPSARVVVTSSGFAMAPPAAFSLVAPCVSGLRTLLDDAARVTSAKVERTRPTDSDYASLGHAARSAAMDGVLRAAPERFAGAHVIALDDIVVTGLHERALDRVLRASGALTVTHLYLVDGTAYRDDPLAEAELNGTSVTTVADLLPLTAAQGFAPNARAARLVLGSTPDEIREFVAHAPAWVVRWFRDVALGDGLAELAELAPGASHLRSLIGELV